MISPTVIQDLAALTHCDKDVRSAPVVGCSGINGRSVLISVNTPTKEEQEGGPLTQCDNRTVIDEIRDQTNSRKPRVLPILWRPLHALRKPGVPRLQLIVQLADGGEDGFVGGVFDLGGLNVARDFPGEYVYLKETRGEMRLVG